MSRLLLPLLAGASLVAYGCRPRVVEFTEVDTGAFPQSQLWLDPERIEFDASANEQFGTFAAHNLGDAPLTFATIELVGDDAFTLVADDLPGTIEPGGRIEVLVHYATGVDHASAQVLISSDDPDSPLAHVTLTGEPLVPELYVTPAEYDFGTVSPGCEVEQDLVLFNLGKADLEINNLQYSTDNQWLWVSRAPDLPVVLEPGEAATVTVTFAPEEEGMDSATLMVFSTDPEALASATQRGESEWEWVHATELSYRPVDLVLVLDQSGTMTDDLSRVADAMEALVDGLDEAGLDWQAAVVSAESGCFHYDIVTSTTVDPATTLSEAVQDFHYGGWAEKLLKLLYSAVLRGDQDDCNAGLFRDDAILHGVVITDEPHQDTEPAPYWVEELQDELGEEARLIVSAVAGDVPGGCTGASPGVDYDDAVEMTGGLFLSICDELDRMGELGATSKRAVVPLSPQPNTDTISVEVDGVEWTDGWHLDQEDTRLVFDTQPEGEVEVTYGVKDCDPDD